MASITGNFTCASLACDQAASIVVAGVPLCDDHRRLVMADLTLPRPRYIADDGVPWFVYYITWPHKPDVVKIGATKNLPGRLNGLKKNGRFPAVLVIEPGTGNLEAERHAQFGDLCMSHRGEYFRYRSPLTEHIEALRRERPDWLTLVGRLPWWMNPKISTASSGEAPRCAAPRVRDGEPCTLTAGHGTDHPGEGLCRSHELMDCPHPEVIDWHCTQCRRLVFDAA
jgi:hypothetical protein